MMWHSVIVSLVNGDELWSSKKSVSFSKVYGKVLLAINDVSNFASRPKEGRMYRRSKVEERGIYRHPKYLEGRETTIKRLPHTTF